MKLNSKYFTSLLVIGSLCLIPASSTKAEVLVYDNGASTDESNQYDISDDFGWGSNSFTVSGPVALNEVQAVVEIIKKTRALHQQVGLRVRPLRMSARPQKRCGIVTYL